jgi:prephenate dehydratase
MSSSKTIAYQGEPGANSHIACVENFSDHATLPCATFEDAFAALQDGSADLAMIPIENSIAGRVADIHNLLPSSGLHIIGETFLPIHFQLLALPGARLDGLRSVHSHVHALGQCRKIIRRYALKPVVASDTAGSAREVAEARDPTRASLATRLAGDIHGLQILAEDVEDEAHNTTRFVVLAKSAQWAPAVSGAAVTTFVFRVRNVPASLYKALGGFATNGVNMTKLESYMVEGEFSATQFLADVDGHPDDPPLARALEELEFFSREVRILGVYPAHPFRRESQNALARET